MTHPDSPELDEILDKLATEIHNLNPGDVGSMDRVLAPISQTKAALNAYTLAQVKDIVGDNGLIDPNDPAGSEGAAWKYNAKAELRREILDAATARFGGEEL